MSFASEVKDELSKINIQESHCAFSELEAFFRLGSEISLSSEGVKISFSSKNITISRCFLVLLKRFYNCDVEIDQRQVMQFGQKNIYSIVIRSMCDAIIEEMNLFDEDKNGKEDILNRECCISSYLRGAFICKGSVNNPKSNTYHLEINSSSENEILYIQRLMNYYDLNAKICKRRDNLVVYIKDINSITDFLRIIGAQKKVFELENIIITRGVSSNIQKVINCEIANEAKTLIAAKEQIRYIHYLKYNYPLEKIDKKILLVMKVREDNPEANMNEIIKIIKDEYGEDISKSGLNHRFRKIKELAIEYQNRRK